MHHDDDPITTQLLPRAALLARLLLRQSLVGIPRSEAGVLGTLARGERRVTELAEHEGLAQPTMTLLVKRLEERGWVVRKPDPDDRRAVLVSLTPAGVAALEQARAGYREVLARHLDAMSADEIAALTTATEALGHLIDVLQRGDAR
jgi:DNA-binding MarR family transcriptional regulator